MREPLIENITARVDLTEEDKVQILNEVVEFSRKIDNQKIQKKNLSEIIKEHQEEIGKRIDAVREGKIEKQVRCMKTISGNIVQYHNLVGELVHFREANSRELQMEIPGIDAE